MPTLAKYVYFTVYYWFVYSFGEYGHGRFLYSSLLLYKIDAGK